MRSRSFLLPLALLLVGCQESPRLLGPAAEAPLPDDRSVVAQIALEVDPAIGVVQLRQGAGVASGAGGPSLTRVPVTADHVEASVTCEGCGNQALEDQVLTVRFTVKDIVLDSVDFRRDEVGDAAAPMHCVNCRVRVAVLRHPGLQLPRESVGPEDVFEAVLYVDALQPGPFTVHFDLVAARTRTAVRFVQVSAGENNCGLHADGTVTCGPTDLQPPGAGFVQVDAGYANVVGCGVRGDGTLTCWGSELLVRYSNPPEEGWACDHPSLWLYTCTLHSSDFTQVSTGGSHVCALRGDGSVYCWGDNWAGQVGGSPTYSATHTHEGPFVQVSASNSHTCALRRDGSISCWGAVDGGGGIPDLGQASPPPGTDFVQVSAGHTHSCALRRDGSVICWGDDSEGQVSGVPDATFTQVSAGVEHTCALRSDGTLACWGSNELGQATPPAGTFTQLSAANWGTCALRSTGTVACWGASWAVVPPRW